MFDTVTVRLRAAARSSALMAPPRTWRAQHKDGSPAPQDFTQGRVLAVNCRELAEELLPLLQPGKRAATASPAQSSPAKRSRQTTLFGATAAAASPAAPAAAQSGSGKEAAE